MLGEMGLEEAILTFGCNPSLIGIRHRGWWIVSEIDSEEESAGAHIGDLCVKTRDGGSNQISLEALNMPNCIGTSMDTFDCTYRYYYYRKTEVLTGESK